MERAEVARLEEAAAGAWPAAVVDAWGGWRFRATPGARSRRVNSVQPFRAGHAVDDLDRHLQAAADFYGALGLPLRVQVSPAAEPPDLDWRLEQAGYAPEAPTDVLVASARAVAQAAAAPAGPAVQLAPGPDPGWFAAYLRLTSYSQDPPEVLAGIFRRIAGTVCQASVHLDGQPVAVAMAVLHLGWTGLFAFATDPRYRRRGAARALLAALAGWSRDQGCDRLFLQVAAGNTPARTLYVGSGFTRAYGYHYRQR